MNCRAYMVLLATLAIGACQIEKPSMDMMFNPGSLPSRPSLDASGCAQVDMGYFSPIDIMPKQTHECKLSCASNDVKMKCDTIGKESFDGFKESIKDIFNTKKFQSAEFQFVHTIKSINAPLPVEIDKADVLIGDRSYRILPVVSGTMSDSGTVISFQTGNYGFQEKIPMTYSQVENSQFPKWEISMKISGSGTCDDGKYKSSTLIWSLETDQKIQGLKVECK